MKYQIRTRKEGHSIELNDLSDSQRLRTFGRYSAFLSSPMGSELLIDAYHRSKSTGRSLGSEIVLLSVRGPRLYEPTPEERARAKGEVEKARILRDLQTAGLTPNESLILTRRDINRSPENSPIWTVDLILDQHGITQYVENRTIESHGVQVPVLVAREISIEDYPKYSALADAAIQRHIASQKPRS